jgi:hypothetical protein
MTLHKYLKKTNFSTSSIANSLKLLKPAVLYVDIEIYISNDFYSFGAFIKRKDIVQLGSQLIMYLSVRLDDLVAIYIPTSSFYPSKINIEPKTTTDSKAETHLLCYNSLTILEHCTLINDKLCNLMGFKLNLTPNF